MLAAVVKVSKVMEEDEFLSQNGFKDKEEFIQELSLSFKTYGRVKLWGKLWNIKAYSIF